MATSFALGIGEPLVLLAPLSVALQVLASCHVKDLGGLTDLTGLGFYDWTGLWWPFPGGEGEGGVRQATVATAPAVDQVVLPREMGVGPPLVAEQVVQVPVISEAEFVNTVEPGHVDFPIPDLPTFSGSHIDPGPSWQAEERCTANELVLG